MTHAQIGNLLATGMAALSLTACSPDAVAPPSNTTATGTTGTVGTMATGSIGGTADGPSPQASSSMPVAFVVPTDGQTVSGTLAIDASAYSNVAFSNFYLDGNGIGEANNDNGSLTTKLDTTNLATGAHTLSVNVYDASSTYLSGASVSISVGAGSGTTTGGTTTGSTTTGGTTPAPSSTVPAGAKLTFDDEFAKLSISDTDGAASTWFSDTIACCMDDTSGNLPASMAGIGAPAGQNPFSLAAGGGLDIRLQKSNNAWYSGVLATVDRNGKGFSQTYGYFEVKAKLPTGQGTWPSFWLDSVARSSATYPGYYDCEGEIDVFEEYGQNGPIANLYTTLHDWTNGTTPDGPYNVQEPNALDGNFHVFGMLWTQTTMTFYFDGASYYSVSTPSIMQGRPYFLILDLGLGGGWPTDKTPARNDYIVQYVRAYQLP